jgi:hypothetical protein
MQTTLTDEQIEAAIEDACSEYETAKDDALKQVDDEDLCRFRGMQVVMGDNERGCRLGDPIDYPPDPPDTLTVEQVRKWIEEAIKEGADDLVLQGGFDTAGDADDFDNGNYNPEASFFEVTLWERKE